MEVLDSYIRQYMEANSSHNGVTFAWQGGEPTLPGMDFYRQAIAIQQKYGAGRCIENTLQTNGLLLDDEWCAFLKEHDFLVGISIDGPEHLHDSCRVDKGGNPSFGHVMRGLERLVKHGVRFNTLTVVHRRNALYPIEVYEFLKSIGSTFLQFIPLVEHKDGQISHESVGGLAWGEFLGTIFERWVRMDVARIYVQMFDTALESWLSLPQSLCFFRNTCGAALAMEHNGDLYACDHFVDVGHHLGNIMETPMAKLAVTSSQIVFGNAKRDTLPSYCRQCDVRFACNGECPKNRLIRTPDGEDGLNWLCVGYKSFFHQIDPYMKYMAHQIILRRPPANIMAFLKDREQGK